MLQSRDVIEQKQGNHIIRIRSDSETNLDDLFTAVMQPKVSQKQGHLSVPMRMRNLPASFFQQPDHCINSPSHSRESSLDNTLSQPSTNATSLQNNSINNNTPPPPPLQSSHLRAHSSPATFQQMYDITAQQHEHLRQQSFDVTDNIPLPPGWQMAKTASGQRYFLNHHTQTTTWKDPRQKLSTGSLSNSSEIACSSRSISPASSLPSLGPLPDGWEQATTDEGEVYFINHNTCTTSWFPPKISMQLQQPLAAPILSTQDLNINSRLQTNASSSAATSSPIINSQTMQQQQQLRLQQLQMEREALRLRQQEIMAQELMLGRNKTFQRTSSSNTSEKCSTNRSSVDPFLSTDKDFHSRQESSDSGLDMGTSYSHPNTPDDYLMSTDDVVLDIAELNLGSISVSSLDMVPENMDSDDLEPSFQGVLNENILQLNDVQELINKENALKWL